MLHNLYIVVPRGCGKNIVGGVIVTKKNNLTPWNTKLHCDKIVELFRTGLIDKADIIYCPGGVFLPKKFQSIPIGKIMTNYLRKNGINNNRIITEENSLTTKSMVQNISKILFQNRINSSNYQIVSVAHILHNLRIALLLKSYGFNKAKMLNLFYSLPFKDLLHDILAYFLVMFDKKGKSLIYVNEEETRRMRKTSFWS